MGSYSYASSTTTISDREEGMEIEKLLPYRYFLLLIPPAISMASYSFISTQTQVVRAHRFLVLVAHCSPKRICLFHTSRQHIAWLLYTDTTFLSTFTLLASLSTSMIYTELRVGFCVHSCPFRACFPL